MAENIINSDAHLVRTITLGIIGLVLFSSCSKLKENAEVTAPKLTVHSAEFERDTTSKEFHAVVLKSSDWNLSQCAQCHGLDYKGGRAEKSCFTCHPAFPHPKGFADPPSPEFHGKSLKSTNWNLAPCASCHGSDWLGGRYGITSCYTCHNSFPHVPGWKLVSSSRFHGKFLADHQWQLQACQVCHGTDYQGGNTGISCSGSGCHVNRTPEACNTCHGNFSGAINDTLSWAPPRDLAGNTSETNPGVGAHQAHLRTGDIRIGVKCNECHIVPQPQDVLSPRHLTPVSVVVFDDTLSKHATAIVPNPQWNPSSLTCTSVYCHGDFQFSKAASRYSFAYKDSVMQGNNASPIWNGRDQAECGSCHDIPPKGHIDQPISACANCHGDVVNSSGEIVNKTKHINGKINVFGQEY